MSVDPLYLEQVAAAANSVEYLIFRNLDRMTSAYIAMLNSQTLDEANTALADVRTTVVELQENIQTILDRFGAPPTMVINVNAHALKVWTGAPFDGLMQNCYHWLQRMMRSRSHVEKVRAMTAVYFLLKDLSDCANTIKAENYYGRALSGLS